MVRYRKRKALKNICLFICLLWPSRKLFVSIYFRLGSFHDHLSYLSLANTLWGRFCSFVFVILRIHYYYYSVRSDLIKRCCKKVRWKKNQTRKLLLFFLTTYLQNKAEKKTTLFFYYVKPHRPLYVFVFQHVIVPTTVQLNRLIYIFSWH